MTDQQYPTRVICQRCHEGIYIQLAWQYTEVCPSCKWVIMKDALCAQCDHGEMIECDWEVDGGLCLVGGYHCRHYHVDCEMMYPQQTEMFIEQEQEQS